jgi:adenylate cyclase
MNNQGVRIPPELLPAFRQLQNERLVKTLRTSLFGGSLIVILFLPWERWHDTAGEVPGVWIIGGLATFLLALGGLTFHERMRPHLATIAVVGRFGTAASVSLVLALLNDGFLFGSAALILMMIVSTVLMVDLRLLPALSLPAMLVVIPNVMMVIEGAPFLTVMNTNWILIPAALLSVGLAYQIDQAHRRAFLFEQALADERDRSEHLLHALLPVGIAEQLKESDDYIAEIVPEATVAFADFVGFTALSERLSAQELIAILTETFTALDEAAARYGLEKIKTIGDAYMVGAGVADAAGSDARSVAEFAQDTVRIIQHYSQATGLPIDVRVGIASGPLVSGVIGRRKPHFDLWGTTVNRARRLVDSAPAGTIHIDMATADHLRGTYGLSPCRSTYLYGIGEIETCLLLEPLAPAGYERGFELEPAVSRHSGRRRGSAEHTDLPLMVPAPALLDV